MKYAITYIAEKLKATREAKGLSQRKLSQLAGVPQGHISKIESGNVDLRVSSLIELTRALGLELTLVPRNTLPAVNTIARGNVHNSKNFIESTSTVQKELKRIENTVTNLVRENPTNKKLAQFHRQTKELQNLRVPDSYLETIREADKNLRLIQKHSESLGTIGKTLSEFQRLRNSLVHGLTETSRLKAIRPAYSLDENDDG